MFVQFEDDSESVIFSLFSCPQDTDVWLNQGEVQISDPRYKTFYESQAGSIQAMLPSPV